VQLIAVNVFGTCVGAFCENSCTDVLSITFLFTTCPHEVFFGYTTLCSAVVQIFLMEIAPSDSMIRPLKNIKVLLLASALQEPTAEI
jgi:hypothetical protein